VDPKERLLNYGEEPSHPQYHLWYIHIYKIVNQFRVNMQISISLNQNIKFPKFMNMLKFQFDDITKSNNIMVWFKYERKINRENISIENYQLELEKKENSRWVRGLLGFTKEERNWWENTLLEKNGNGSG